MRVCAGAGAAWEPGGHALMHALEGLANCMAPGSQWRLSAMRAAGCRCGTARPAPPCVACLFTAASASRLQRVVEPIEPSHNQTLAALLALV